MPLFKMNKKVGDIFAFFKGKRRRLLTQSTTEVEADRTYKGSSVFEKDLRHQRTYSPSIDLAGTTDIDASQGNIFRKVVAANSTFAVSNIMDGQTIIVALQASGADRTIGFSSTSGTIKWAAGTVNGLIVSGKWNVYTLFRADANIFVNSSRDF